MPFGNPILGGGGALVRSEIRSPNYVAGVSGWSIQRSGSAEFADVTVRGGVFISPSISGTVSGQATYDTPTIETGTLDGPTLDGSGEIVASGQLASANYLAGSTGWAIDGDGNAEFNDITARGEIGTGGALVSSNYVAGVSGWAIDGDGDAEFNSALVRGDLITGPSGAGLYYVTSFVGSGPGGATDGVGLIGPDPGTVGTPAYLYLTQAYPAPTFPASFNSHAELGAADSVRISSPNGVIEMAGPIDYLGTQFNYAQPVAPTFFTDTDLFKFSGNVRAGTGQDVQLGNGLGMPNDWANHEGVFHKDLASGYMIMSDGTSTFIGADSTIHLRPVNNAGVTYLFDAAGAEFNAWPESGPNFYTNWSNWGGAFGALRIWKDPIGTVHVTGLVRRSVSGSGAPSAILLLPSWAFTDRQIIAACMTNVSGVSARIDVYTNGQIVTSDSIAAGGWVALHLTYRATTRGL